MYPIRSFVVRIYRRDRRSIAGSVEDVRSGKSTFFQSFSDLWNVLTSRSPGSTTATPTITVATTNRPETIESAAAAASGDRDDR